MQNRHHTQVLIIGAGLSGCTSALTLADAGIQVTLIVSESTLDGGNSALAQGGIVYAPNSNGSSGSHNSTASAGSAGSTGSTKSHSSTEDLVNLKKDILIAGHNHNYHKAVDFLCQQGGEAVEKLLLNRVKVPFDLEAGQLSFTREGGHSSHRIIHSADHSGRSIMEQLIAAVQVSPNIIVRYNCTAIDLITSHHQSRLKEARYQLDNKCLGAYVLNSCSNTVETVLADLTILATGGVGQVYLHTTNTPASTGSGIAMASRANVRLDNLEYVQFHPTSLYAQKPSRFLITEALRGEGAKLVTATGHPFMPKHDPRADLAPRDIVAQAIAEEMLYSGDPCVYLDLSEVKQNIPQRFPTIYQHCLNLGIDITQSPIPVVPSAHYFCGGILVNQYGQTSLSQLYSVGECSCTGLHGANRLASTSLLEALLWGYSAAKHIISHAPKRSLLSKKLINSIPDWQTTGDEDNDDPALIAQDWATIRHTMWNYVGISRTQSRLQRAFDDLRDLSRHLHTFYRDTPISKPIVDLFHGCQTAYIITQSALRNPKSLGCHHRVN